MTVGAIVLAAGSARRMGQDKLLADLGGMPVVGHVLRAIEAAGLPPALLALAPGSAVAAVAGSAVLVEVASHEKGMGHSLAEAITAAPPDWDAAIICLGDMPFVSRATLLMLAARATATSIVRPSFEGKPGNPVAWGREYFAELAACAGDQGGRTLLGRYADRILTLPCDDPGVRRDIDTPQDLAAARESL